MSVPDAGADTREQGDALGSAVGDDLRLLLRVERGNPDAEEIAALAVVLAAAGATEAIEARRAARRGWGSRYRTVLPRRPRGRAWGGW